MSATWHIIRSSILSFLASKGLKLLALDTYTPVYTQTGGGAITTNSISGRYMRIGRLCWIQISHNFDHASGSGDGSNPTYTLPFNTDGSVALGLSRYYSGTVGTTLSYPDTEIHPNVANKAVATETVDEGSNGILHTINAIYVISASV